MTALNALRNFLGLYSLVIGGAAVVAIVMAALLFAFFPELQTPARALIAVALMLLLLFLAGAYSEVRGTVLSRQTRYGTNTGLMVAAFFGIAVLLNVVSAQNTKRFDLTESGQYTLSRHTQAALKNLKGPVKVVGFFTREPASQAGKQSAENLLSEYRYHSDKISFEFHDPEAEPGLARQYEIRDDQAMVFEYEGRRRQVYGIGEQEFTGAVLNVTGTEQPKIYFVTGHGEPELDSTEQRGFSFARDGLTTDNYDVRQLSLSTISRIPEDAGVIIVPAPKAPVLDSEVRLLNGYLEGGGKALFLLDPNPPEHVRQLLTKWGVRLNDGIVVDQQFFVQPDVTVPVAQQYDRGNIITKDLAASFFPGAAGMSIDVPEDDRDHVFVSPIAITSILSFLETEPGDRPQYDEGKDRRGPLPLALTVVADKPIGQRPQRQAPTPLPGTTAPQINPAPPSSNPTRLVVFADTDFATNQFFYSLGNSDLFLNSVNWLTQQEELISIRPKPDTSRKLVATTRTWNFIIFSSVGLWPLVLMVAAGVVYWRRR